MTVCTLVSNMILDYQTYTVCVSTLVLLYMGNSEFEGVPLLETSCL